MKRFRELFLYLLFGGLTTLVNFTAYSLTVDHCGITLSNAIAWAAAVLFAFFTNKAYVFRSKASALGAVLRELAAFVGGRAVSGVLEIFLPGILVQLGLNQTAFGITGFWAKAAVSVFVVVLNYFVSKFIVFKSGR